MEIKSLNNKWNASAIVDRIEYLCKSYHISINKLAIMSGVTASTIYSFKTRSSTPRLETLISICDALGISLSDFFGEEDRSKWEVSK